MKYILNSHCTAVARVESFPCPSPPGFEPFRFFIFSAGRWEHGVFVPSEKFYVGIEYFPGVVCRMSPTFKHPGFDTVEEAEAHLPLTLAQFTPATFANLVNRFYNSYKDDINANLPSLS